MTNQTLAHYNMISAMSDVEFEYYMSIEQAAAEHNFRVYNAAHPDAGDWTEIDTDFDGNPIVGS